MITRPRYNHFPAMLVEDKNIYLWLMGISSCVIDMPDDILRYIAILFLHLPRLTTEQLFNFQIQQNCPLLEKNDIQLYIPKLAFEFAKFQHPEKMSEIGEFLIDGNARFEIQDKYLVIVYKKLFGKKSFDILASIFNECDPDFDAHYTDSSDCTDNSIDKYLHRYYSLCLDINTFFKHVFSIHNNPIANAGQDDKAMNLYRKSEYKSKMELEFYFIDSVPANHYPVHPLEIKIMHSRAAAYIENNHRVECGIHEWKLMKHMESFIDNFIYLTGYLNANKVQFPIEILLNIVFLVSTKLKLETTSSLKVDNGMCRLFGMARCSIAQIEKNMLDLVNKVIHTAKANSCVVSDDMVIIKFAMMDRHQFSKISKQFGGLFKCRKQFNIKTFKYKGSEDTFNMYITFSKEKYYLLEKELRKKTDNILEKKPGKHHWSRK